MQHFTFLKNGAEHSVQIPSADTELLPGIQWGNPCALFTPAYWYTQYLMHNPTDTESRMHRIGQTFAEEITACILGGHGISAEIGLAAFYRLRDDGLISNLCTDQQVLERRLREPVHVMGRTATYRFWRRKAMYLAAAYSEIQTQEFPANDALPLRNKLMTLPGVGPKTASWIVRNWLGSDQVAILDIHIVRAGLLVDLFSADDNVSKDYIAMESKFVAFSRALGVPTSDLDALIWGMMRTTPKLVKRLLNQMPAAAQSGSSSLARPIQSPGA